MIPQRNPRSPRVLSVRSLVPADLEALRPHSARARLAKLRDRHHKLARYLASGMSYADIAEATGYSYIRVATLAVDPSMKELAATYRDKLTEKWVESEDAIIKQIRINTIMGLEQITDQLEDAEESGEIIPINRLLAIAADGLDRIGYQKRTTNVNVNVDFAKNLEAAIARSRKIIEHEPAE